MKRLVKITHTDIHQSQSSERFIGLAEDVEQAIKLARQDNDAIQDVRENEGIIVFDWVTVGKLESEERISSTDFDDFKERIVPSGVYYTKFGEVIVRPASIDLDGTNLEEGVEIVNEDNGILKWKDNKLYIGKVKVASVFYSAFVSRGETKRYQATCFLPAIKSDLGKHESIEEAKKIAERAVKRFFKLLSIEDEEES